MTRPPVRLPTLLAVELAKLRRQRMALVTFLVPAVLALLLPPLTLAAGASPEHGFRALAHTLELALLAASYLIFLHAATTVAAERYDRTLRDALVAPSGRGAMALARWLGLQCGALVLLGAVMLLAYASTSMCFTFGDVYGDAIEPLAEADELRSFTFLAHAYLVLPFVALVSVGFLVSVLARSPAPAAAGGLGVLLTLDIVKSVLPASSEAGRYLFNSYLPTLFDRTSYLYGVAAFAEGYTDELWLDNASEHLWCWAAPLATIAVATALAVVVFRCRESRE